MSTATLLLLAAALSTAQGPAGPFLPMVPLAKSSPKAFVGLQRFASCALKYGRSSIGRYLAMPFPSPEGQTAATEVMEDYSICLDTEAFRGRVEYVRGAFIEAAYQSHLGTPGALKIALGEVDPDHHYGRYLRLAQCVLDRSAEGAAMVLRTRPASNEQASAFKAIDPVVQTCAKAQQLQPTATQLLRFAIAEALYRRLPDAPSAAR